MPGKLNCVLLVHSAFTRTPNLYLHAQGLHHTLPCTPTQQVCKPLQTKPTLQLDAQLGPHISLTFRTIVHMPHIPPTMNVWVTPYLPTASKDVSQCSMSHASNTQTKGQQLNRNLSGAGSRPNDPVGLQHVHVRPHNLLESPQAFTSSSPLCTPICR